VARRDAPAELIVLLGVERIMPRLTS